MPASTKFVALVSVIFAVGAVAQRPASGAEGLVVHEWGTFTALQDEQGRALSGINIDDEPVPGFVHNLNPYVVAQSYSLRAVQMKGAPQRHPFITVRLETPVMYFYPPAGSGPLTLDVQVAMQGGWLTEYYPFAEARAPGIGDGDFQFGAITPKTVGSLTWKNLQVGTSGQWPQTNEHVWTAPRKVASVPVSIATGESEKYLFYRGVGNFDAPLRVSTDRDSHTLSIRGRFDDLAREGAPVRVGSLWLVHIRRDGACAFRSLAPLEIGGDSKAVAATHSSAFEEQDFSAENMQRLQAEMHAALVAAGLFADEATAMLSTWQRAYFKSPGLRLFFVVPPAWTDRRLPLEISERAEITRVMMARIELISDEQRQLLDRLAQAEISSPAWTDPIFERADAYSFVAGRSDFQTLGLAVPPDYQMYMDLGRFRNALLIHEEQQRPTPSLTKFIEAYGLEAFRVETGATTAEEH